MLHPIRLVNNIFNDKNLSDANLRSFTEDALMRMAAKNPGGIYTTIIADTTLKYTAYYGVIQSELVKKAISEGLTITMNEARAASYDKIVTIQGLVIYKFGSGSAVYQEFYPQTLEEYEKAKLDDYPPLLNRFVDSAVTHLTADYPADVAAIKDVRDAFIDARNTQKNMFITIGNLGTDRHATRLHLTTQLTFDYLIIASNNIDNPDSFDDYYDPSYLPLTEDDTIEEIIDPGATLHTYRSLSPDTDYLITIDSGSLLLGYAAARSTPITSETGTSFNAGTDIAINAGTLGFTTVNRYLNITNNTGAAVKMKIGRKP